MPSDLLDLNELDRLCKAATNTPHCVDHDNCEACSAWGAFGLAANPEAVGKLIAAVRTVHADCVRYDETGSIRKSFAELLRAAGIAPASVEERP